MNVEMQALSKNETWDLVLSSPHQKVIGCRWMPMAPIISIRPRLIAKGYVQTHIVDYEETFAPVAKMTTIRTVIVLAVAKGWHLH